MPVQQQAQFPLITVNPGDRIVASVVQLQPSPQTWQIMLMDVSTGVTFTRIVPFPSVNAYPSFIVEDPNAGPPGPSGPFYPFPHWGTVTFSNMEVRIQDTWMPAATLYTDRILMVRNGQVLATAGPLSISSSFTAVQA